MTMKVVLLTIPLGQATLPHTPVQVWERGLSSSPYGTSPLNREVERFLLCPLSWERGPMTSHQFQRWSTRTREVEPFHCIRSTGER